MGILEPKNKYWRNLFLLIFANFITLLIYIRYGGSVEQTILVYYFQTVLITIFYYKKIYISHYLSEMIGKKKMDAKIKKTVRYRTVNEQFAYLFIVMFPVLIGGFFLAGWLFSEQRSPTFDWFQVAIAAAAFFIHHYYSYRLMIHEIPKRKRRWTGYTLVPYKKLFIRIGSILVIVFIVLEITNNTAIIILFILIKIFLDIMLSSAAQEISDS